MQILRKALLAVVAIALIAGSVLFSTNNLESVRVNYVVGESELPIWQLAALAFATGALVAWVLSLLALSRAKLEARRQRKSVGRLERELHQLRNLPLAGEERGAEPIAAEASAPVDAARSS